MQHLLVTLLLTAIVMMTKGCRFYLRGKTNAPEELQAIILDSRDPYGPLTQNIKTQLHLSDIFIVDASTRQQRKSILSLRIGTESYRQITASTFRDGKTI